MDSYIRSLSRKARKNYKYVTKMNSDIRYNNVILDRDKLINYMSLWEKQPIRGITRRWAYPPEYVIDKYNNGEMLLFECELAMHFIQNRKNFYVAHPPMYDKSDKNLKRYLAKFMWFKLIEYFINNKLGILDLGGGNDDSWREMIRTRHLYPNPAYKWVYIPEHIKNNPDSQIDYRVDTINGQRFLLTN